MPRSMRPSIAAATPWSRTASLMSRMTGAAWLASDKEPDRAVRSTDGQLAIELELGDDAVAAELLGQIERTVAAVDEISHRLAELELADADRHRDLRQDLAGGPPGELAVGDGASDPIGDGRAAFEIGLRHHGDQLLAAVARGKIVVADTFTQRFGHEAQHLIADAMAVIVVELLEVIDVDQENAERLVPLHRRDLDLPEELLERAAVRQPGERVGERPLLRLVQRIADGVELARFLGEARFQLGRARGGFGKFTDEILDQDLRINTLRAPFGHAVNRLDVSAVVGNRRSQVLFGGVHHAVQLLRHFVDDRRFGTLLADIGVEQGLVRRLVELALVADENVDRAIQVRSRSQRVFEP